MKYQLLAATAALFAAGTASAAELVTNGNFSAGATGFNTTYGPPGAPSSQGMVTTTTNPNALCGCFVAIGDHTTGTGNMLLIDGADTNTGAFWSQTFAVLANSSYSFSMWATNVGTAGPVPTLRATANASLLFTGQSLGYSTGNTATTWLNLTGTFNSGAATSVTLSLFDQNLSFLYNDFAVDDISFTGPAPAVAGVPEPATWAMMMLGFGALGAVMRRRQQVTARVRYA